jgi:hypothetical protein
MIERIGNKGICVGASILGAEDEVRGYLSLCSHDCHVMSCTAYMCSMVTSSEYRAEVAKLGKDTWRSEGTMWGIGEHAWRNERR